MQCNQVPRSSTIVRRQLRAGDSMVATALLVLAWARERHSRARHRRRHWGRFWLFLARLINNEEVA
jgi:hypothetical protein